MRSAWLILVPVLALAPPTWAAPNPSLQKAAKAFAELNYADANRAIEAALKQPGNDREALLQILQLQAIILATLGESARSTRAFSQLLALNPDFALTGNHPPRVTTAFFEARAWAAANGRLEAKALEPLVEPGAVKALRVEVTKDPLKQVKRVRFNFPGGPVVSGLTGNVAAGALKMKALEVNWWAELLGEKDAVLLEVGDAATLQTARAPEKPAEAAAQLPPTPPVEKVEPTRPPQKAVEPPPPAAPVVEKKPDPPPAAPVVAKKPKPAPSPPTSGKLLAAVGLLGAAVVCGAIGSGFGLMSNGTRAQVDSAPTNSAGHVDGMTQVQGFELDGKQRGQATAANALFISAGVLAAAGGVLFVLGVSSSGASAAIVPTGPGVAVVGTLP